MNAKILILLLTSVSLSSIAQILLKTGMSEPHVALAIDGDSWIKAISAAVFNFWVIAGLTLYFLTAVLWLFVLARIEVSLAYPFVGLGFVLTMILGKFFMGDAVSATRVLGTLLIAVGVVFVSVP